MKENEEWEYLMGWKPRHITTHYTLSMRWLKKQNERIAALELAGAKERDQIQQKLAQAMGFQMWKDIDSTCDDSNGYFIGEHDAVTIAGAAAEYIRNQVRELAVLTERVHVREVCIRDLIAERTAVTNELLPVLDNKGLENVSAVMLAKTVADYTRFLISRWVDALGEVERLKESSLAKELAEVCKARDVMREKRDAAYAARDAAGRYEGILKLLIEALEENHTDVISSDVWGLIDDAKEAIAQANNDEADQEDATPDAPTRSSFGPLAPEPGTSLDEGDEAELDPAKIKRPYKQTTAVAMVEGGR